MAIHRLECSMVVPRPLEDVFAVYETPLNLARITPPWLNFRIVTKGKIVMREGARIDYAIRWLGLPLRWRTLITAYDPPHRFVDEQERGPYPFWRHTHTFTSLAEGILVADSVDYCLPAGVLGEIAHMLAVGEQLRTIFRFRQQAVAEMFGVPLIEGQAPAVVKLRRGSAARGSKTAPSS